MTLIIRIFANKLRDSDFSLSDAQTDLMNKTLRMGSKSIECHGKESPEGDEI